jgi:hypothetical protein
MFPCSEYGTCKLSIVFSVKYKACLEDDDERKNMMTISETPDKSSNSMKQDDP